MSKEITNPNEALLALASVVLESHALQMGGQEVYRHPGGHCAGCEALRATSSLRKGVEIGSATLSSLQARNYEDYVSHVTVERNPPGYTLEMDPPLNPPYSGDPFDFPDLCPSCGSIHGGSCITPVVNHPNVSISEKIFEGMQKGTPPSVLKEEILEALGVNRGEREVSELEDSDLREIDEDSEGA